MLDDSDKDDSDSDKDDSDIDATIEVYDDNTIIWNKKGSYDVPSNPNLEVVDFSNNC